MGRLSAEEGCELIDCGTDLHADLSRTRVGEYNPQQDIAMLFSKPESIDCVISALQAIKKATFGENNLVSVYLNRPVCS